MKEVFGHSVTETWRRAEIEAEQCLKDAMEETGLPENAFEIKYNDSTEHPKVVGWSVHLASKK